MTSWIRWFRDIKLSDVPLVGGKAASLATRPGEVLSPRLGFPRTTSFRRFPASRRPKRPIFNRFPFLLGGIALALPPAGGGHHGLAGRVWRLGHPGVLGGKCGEYARLEHLCLGRGRRNDPAPVHAGDQKQAAPLLVQRCPPRRRGGIRGARTTRVPEDERVELQHVRSADGRDVPSQLSRSRTEGAGSNRPAAFVDEAVVALRFPLGSRNGAAFEPRQGGDQR